MTNKYVHKKWANTDDWSHDPAWLFENKPKKYQKYVTYYQENFQGQATKKKVNYKNKDDSSDSEEFQKAEPVKKSAGLGAPPAPSRVAAAKPATAAPDLLSFDTSGPAATGGLTNDMFASKPDDGFGDFA